MLKGFAGALGGHRTRHAWVCAIASCHVCGCILARLVVTSHAGTLGVSHHSGRHLHGFLERLILWQIVVRRRHRSRSHLLPVLGHVARGTQGLLRVGAVA